MLDTTRPLRVVIDGTPHWQYPDGRRLPIMAGAEDPPGGEPRGTEPAGDPPRTEPGGEPREPDPEPRGDGDRPLGETGERALEAERRRAKELERQLKAEQRARKALEDEKLTETERLRREAEEGRTAAATATEKLRRANLLSALADKGLTGANAKAAAKLLDAVEYDDEDEPTNLDDAIRAAAEEYGPTLFKGARRRAPDIDPGGGGGGGDRPALTAEELAAAKSMGQTPEEYAAEKHRYQ